MVGMFPRLNDCLHVIIISWTGDFKQWEKGSKAINFSEKNQSCLTFSQYSDLPDLASRPT